MVKKKAPTRAPRWKPKPASTTTREVKMDGWVNRLHRHGCTTCSGTYEDACGNPRENRLCTDCRDVPHSAPLWEKNLRPVECCGAARKATPEERVTYRLGGDAEWWICPKCFRPQIYKPGTENRSKGWQ